MSTVIKIGNNVRRIGNRLGSAIRFIYIDYFDLNFHGKKVVPLGWWAK